MKPKWLELGDRVHLWYKRGQYVVDKIEGRRITLRTHRLRFTVDIGSIKCYYGGRRILRTPDRCYGIIQHYQSIGML